jgi:hypothetical protein
MTVLLKKILTLTIALLCSSFPIQAEHKPNPPRYTPPQRWCMRSNETLKSALERWSQQAGWVIRWQSAYDYPITVATCLTGPFITTLKTVSQAYQQAEQPLYFDLYPQQRLLVITQ